MSMRVLPASFLIDLHFWSPVWCFVFHICICICIFKNTGLLDETSCLETWNHHAYHHHCHHDQRFDQDRHDHGHQTHLLVDR